jgi:hypothetical protein
MKKNDQGNTLVVVIVLLSALVGIVGAAIQYTQAVARQAQRERTNVTAQAIGDGCIDLMYACWRQICQRDAQVMSNEPYSYVDGTHGTVAPTVPYTYKYSRVTPPPTNSFNSITLPTAAMFPNITNPAFAVTRGAMTGANETVSNYMIQAIEPTFKLTTTDPPLSTVPAGQRPPAAFVADSWTQERVDRDQSWFYLASADITLPTPSGLVTTKMRRVFEKRSVQPWDYLMFFNDDLELHPASTIPLTLFGQVHTNRNLYTGTQYLTFNSVVPKLVGGETTASGMGGTQVGGPKGASGSAKTKGVSYGENWTIGWKPGDNFHSGATTAPTVVAGTPVQRVPKFQLYGWDINQWNSADANQNNDDPHELIEPPVLPYSTHPDPLAPLVGDTWEWSAYGTPGTGGYLATSGFFSNQRLYSRCGIRINISATNVVTITNSNNPPDVLSSLSAPAGPVTTDPLQTDAYEYHWAHDMWKTALGVSPGSTTVPGNLDVTIGGVAHAGQILPYKKNTVASITSGSKSLTTTTAFFAPADVGRLVHATSNLNAFPNIIPKRTKIVGPATTIAAASNAKVLPQATITVVATATAPTASWSATSGQIQVVTSTGPQTVSYTGKTATTFTGCTGGTGTMSTGGAVSGLTEATLSIAATATASGNLKIELEGWNAISDPREAKQVDLITIDYDVFDSWDGGSAGNYFHVPPNYVYDGSKVSGDARRNQTAAMSSSNCMNVFIHIDQAGRAGGHEGAVRLKNCKNLMRNNPDPGSPAVPPYDGILSGNPAIYLITDGPLYIQGDFNTRGYDATDARGAAGIQPPSNTVDLPNSANRVKVWETPVPNIQWDQDTSVLVADSVTLLSNNWDDALSSFALGSRGATSTTVNTRIITGDVPTNATNGYSGGGENLIRLLEDWTGRYLTFSGTLMQLYHSKIGVGTWGKPNVYFEPNPVATQGGRVFYQETAYTYAKPWGFEYFIGYYKHNWSPTP